MADATAVPDNDEIRAQSARTFVLLLRDFCDRELAPIADRITSLKDHETRLVPDVEVACHVIGNEGWHPDLIVVLQSWSDQFSPADVLKLLSLAPLARIVCVAGAWCDSDGRTRASWPLAVRARAVDALSRIDRELAALRISRCCADSKGKTPRVLPLTASRAEIFEADVAGEALTRQEAPRVFVHSPDRGWKEMIERALGIAPRAEAGVGSPEIIVFDADPWSENRHDSLRAAKSHWPEARVIACSGDAAIDFADDLKTAGADAVWFKLSPLAALNRLVAVLVGRVS